MLGNVKSFRLLHRKSGMSIEAFQLHWRTVHAEHALKLNAYLQRYVQNHVWPEPIADFRRPCDGAPELWYQDAEAAQRMSQSPEFRDGAEQDIPNFIGAAAALNVTEQAVKPGPIMTGTPRSIKALFFVKRNPSLTSEEFHRRWQQSNGALVGVARRAMRYIRSFTIDGYGTDDDRPPYDGSEEFWWPNEEAFLRDIDNWEIPATAKEIIDVTGTAGARVDELRFIWPPYEQPGQGDHTQ